MSKLETVQKIWETSTKIFDKMKDDEKKEWMNSLIDELESNKWIKRLKESWNMMDEEQKLKIYKRHSISLWSYFKYTFMPYRMWEKLYNIAKHSITKWDNHTRKYATLEEIPCRFFVQLWILDKPKDLEDKKLKEDIKRRKKYKSVSMTLWMSLYSYSWDKSPSSFNSNCKTLHKTIQKRVSKRCNRKTRRKKII